jgi:hypothetical protein
MSSTLNILLIIWGIKKETFMLDIKTFEKGVEKPPKNSYQEKS